MSDSTKQTTRGGHTAPQSSLGHDSEALLADILSDWKWIYEEIDAGRLREYRGKHFAVVNHQVLGSDTDQLRLRERIAAEYHIHPERVVIYYIDNWDE